TTSSDVVSRTCSPAAGGGASWAPGRSCRAWQTARSPSATTLETTTGRGRARPLRCRLLHNDLAVLPGGGEADIVEVTGLREGNGLRLSLDEHPRIELAAVHRRGRMRQVADVGERHGRARLDANACRREAVLDVVRAGSDRVSAGDDRPRRPGHGRGR